MITMHEPTSRDILQVAAHITPEEQVEMDAFPGLGRNNVEKLAQSIKHSEFAWAVRDGDRCLCIFGCVGADNCGVIWMISTNQLKSHRVKLHKWAKAFIGAMHEKWTTLHNVVHEDNIKTQRWLESLGFHVERGNRHQYGPHYETFFQFRKDYSPCVHQP